LAKGKIVQAVILPHVAN